MNNGFEAIERLGDEAGDLNSTLDQTSGLVRGFDSELRRMRGSLAATGADVANLEKGLSQGLRRAFDGVVFDGLKLSDALQQVSGTMARSTYNAALTPITRHVGGMVSDGVGQLMQGILPFAAGAPFSQGRVLPFANGGIVSGATPFGMRGGMGVMGEAGPEAIMPLARGPDGKLCVRSDAQARPSVIINISTPDVAGFRRSQNQIATQMSRALSRGARNQ